MSFVADCALRFGMLDGDAVVRAESAVFDPQSAFLPELFGKNGSVAGRIAIVANKFEGAQLVDGNVHDVFEIAKKLVSIAHADAVVIKNGAHGAVVSTKDGALEKIPAFETDRVYPLGSGDVFSTIFAHYWMEQGLNAPEAAKKASMAAACYCNSGVLPIPANFETEFKFPAVHVPEDGRLRKIYLAGPFFTLSQLWLIEESRNHLRKDGIEVFSPFHKAGTGPAHEIYVPDIKGLETSDVVFACLDGNDPGTLFEIGYARSRGIPVIAFSENVSEGDLKMVVGSSCEVVSDFCTAIHKAIWQAFRQ